MSLPKGTPVEAQANASTPRLADRLDHLSSDSPSYEALAEILQRRCVGDQQLNLVLHRQNHSGLEIST